MKLNHVSRGALAAAAFVFALAGCSSVNLDEQPPAPIVDATAEHAAPKPGRIRAQSLRSTHRRAQGSTRSTIRTIRCPSAACSSISTALS